MNCPSCSGGMTVMNLVGHNGTPVAIDTCRACHAFWFDRYESLQLSPASTLELFTLIGEQAASGKPAASSALRCPQCRARLLKTQDRQRRTAFSYWRCDHGHGRFITYFNFLREKNFIQPLTPAQIRELRQNVQTVNCSNCGAPVNLATGTACRQCGSPLSMIDMKQAEALMNQLREAAEPRVIDTAALPLELARARREVDAAFASMKGGSNEWWRDAAPSGLVESGLALVGQWFRKWNG